MKTRRVQLACALAATCLLPLAAARADTISVAANAGVGVVAVDGNDGQCSLREAMLLANGAAANADCAALADGNATLTIVLPGTAVFTLFGGPYSSTANPQGPNGMPVVSASYVIAGNGASIRRDTAAGTPHFRLLQVDFGSLRVSNLTLQDGWASGDNTNRGGCLLNNATLTLDDVKIAHCNAASDSGGGRGGGIYSQGTLHMTRTEVSDNLAGNPAVGVIDVSGGVGAGIVNTGTMTISDHSLISGNGVGGLGGTAGGIYNLGNLSISDSTISNNDANLDNDTSNGTHRGGGIYNAETLTLTRSIVKGNHARFGGGIAVGGTAAQTTVRDSIFRANQAYDGGGILVDEAVTTTISGSTFTGNVASHDGGGLYLKHGLTTIVHTTISDNTAHTSGGIEVHGFSPSPSVMLSYVTMAGNRYPGIYAALGSVTVDHSILSANGSACAGTGSGTISSLGYNLDDDGSCGLTQSSDQSGVDPQLAALADNGGPTQTMQPMSGSPVIDAIPALDCATNVPSGMDAGVDQRGVARPQISGCDIGAVELQPYVATFVSYGGSGQHALAGDPFAWPLAVQARDADGYGVANLNVAVSAPASGASATCAPTSTDATGVLLAYCSANMQTGSYTIKFGYPAWRSPSGVTPSLSFRLTNDANDRIFGDGFDGSPLATFSMAAGQSSADIALTLPRGLLAHRITPILVVHDARGHRVALVEARRSGGSTQVRTIDYDAHGYPAYFGAWCVPASSHLQLHLERHAGVVVSQLREATTR